MDDVKQKVFIVDDEPANVLIIETAVETLGTVISTSESHRAIKLIEQHRPDVILLDINMPQLTGFDICTILKSDPSLKDKSAVLGSLKIASTCLDPEEEVGRARTVTTLGTTIYGIS